MNVSISAQKYDLPEGFDPEKDNIWEYDLLDSIDSEYQMQLDSARSEVFTWEMTLPVEIGRAHV